MVRRNVNLGTETRPADPRRGLAKREHTRRIYCRENLPLLRAWFRGPKWKRLCEVQAVSVADYNPLAARYHHPGKKILVFTFEEEIRERILVELGPSTLAMWSDPREQLGLRA